MTSTLSDDMKKYFYHGPVGSQVAMAELEVKEQYGDTVSAFEKKKSLIKFGINSIVDTSRNTVMQLQGTEKNETYVNTNAITHVVTDDNSFTGTVTIEGHYILSGNLVFSTQTATLTGHTAVELSQPLARANRMYINSGAAALSATTDKIYVYEGGATTNGVPNTASETHLLLDGYYGQSQKCATSISSSDYWLVTKAYAGVNKKTSAAVDVELQARYYTDATWRTLFELPVDTNGSSYFQIDAPPIFIIPKNYDVRLVATGSTTGIEVIGGIAGYLAKVIT